MNRALALALSAKLNGWCSAEKAAWLYDTAAEIVAKNSRAMAAEIGVYCGKSFLPIAAAMEPTGLAWAIDLWDNLEANKGNVRGEDVRYWLNVPLAEYRRTFTSAMQGIRHEVLPMTSEAAAECFADGSLSLVHVDGNHNSPLEDFQRWWSKLATGGVFVVDDAGNPWWHQVDAALPWVRERGELIKAGENFQAFRKARP